MNENDSGRIYHIIRDGMVRMAVKGRELKDTDIVESVDEPDSRTQLEADVHRWLTSHVAVSVYTKDVEDEVVGWLDRQAAITERECRDYEDALREQHHKRRFELKAQVDRLTAERDALAKDLAECMDERDSLEHDLSETEAEFAKEMAETLSLHSKQQAASHQAWVDVADERDYWKQEVQFCMDAAYPPSHAPERPYDPRVMAYPTPDECTTPSTLVSEVIDGLRDDVRDTVMPIIEESANAKADCERWREACGSMMDVAHEIERIMAEMELR